MEISKLTPVLFVEEIEPCLEFWTDRLAFEKAVEVPDGANLGFVILTRGNVEIMYQTFASREKDIPGLEKLSQGPSFLYIDVKGLDSIAAALSGYEIFLAERTTFYGARELGIKDPAGNLVIFAEKNS
jgi:uncharacterized glyoxalase superfamily protein PhnB